MSKSKIPHIRFKGFTGVWNENEIGNLANITTGGTPNTSNVSYWNPKQIPWMSSGEINKKRLFSTDNQISELGLNNSSAKWIKNNSVLIALAGQGKTRGTVGINYIPLTTNQSIAAITSDDKLHYEFLYQNLESRYEELRMESSGDGTRGGLNKQIISNIFIFYPEKNEQIRIGNYFYQLDKLIEQKEKKYQKLKQFKKAMLDKMFPKNGASTPEIRFKGFSGEWEEKEINELFNVTRGVVLAATETSSQKSEKMPYPVYSSQTKNNGLLGFYKKYLFENAITWTTDGANAGTVKYREGKFYSTNVNGVLLSNDGYANLAIAEILNNIAWKHVSYVGNPKLMNNVMSKIKIIIPNTIEEQIQISKYIKQLDKQIDLQQKELEKLKNIKKASLAKMFV
ncbi:restriction endonuclease subunit S [Aliarcobacter butzleri]|nr:restriction endonuclease subunit S [Aliarcobacter butzleri]MCG3710941.1 restriction endonuclease subunit S [Aliarcobacter butzleri]MCG3714292.1 restriction endonuclease subunit S [Aliarcobacter butzleri]